LLTIKYLEAAMDIKLTDRELDALRKLVSLGNVYQPLRAEVNSLLACDLVERDGYGSICITQAGRNFLRDFDLRAVQA
jgi:hypothetical protein